MQDETKFGKCKSFKGVMIIIKQDQTLCTSCRAWVKNK